LPESEFHENRILRLETVWAKLHDSLGRINMLRWTLGFLVVALIAAVLGFGGIAVAAAGIAKIIFILFLILFVVTLVGHLLQRT
jgi:uncharacterized membrane protein YtjA (UPF0391 family)